MKKSNIFALLLMVIFVLGILAGCGSKEPTAPDEISVSAAAESAPPAEPEPAPADEASAETIVEASAVEEPTDPIEVMKTEYFSYPLEVEDNTISLWHYMPPYVDLVADNYDYFCVPYAEEATGVHIEFVQVAQTTVVEQFNLMVASHDWADIIPAYEYYTGGLTKAYEEGVILDIGEYAEEYMPNYIDVLNALDPAIQAETLTDGMMLSFNTIADGTYPSSGLVTRGDWMDEQGVTFSGKTIDLEEFTNLMRTLHSAYNTPHTYYIINDGQISLQAAFDTEIPTLADSFLQTINPAIYRVGDECKSGWNSDGYRDYLEWLLMLVDEGVLDHNFPSDTTDMLVRNFATATGDAAVWFATADKIDELAAYVDEANKNFAARPIPMVVEDPAQPYVWQETPSLVTHGMSISASSEKAELVCQWMNYFWTYEGYLMANYGVEGETFEMTDDGFRWLDGYVVGDTPARNAEMAVDIYTMKRFNTFYSDHDRLFPTFTPTALDAVELWTIEGASDQRNYPDAIVFTTEEQEAINEYQADFLTFAQTEILKFLSHTNELNDDTWETYVKTCEQMGINEIIAVYQTAYDQYIAGER